MKPGEVHKLKSCRPVLDEPYTEYLSQMKPSSDLAYAKADAAASVADGSADLVYVVKVLAIVRRSAKVEE